MSPGEREEVVVLCAYLDRYYRSIKSFPPPPKKWVIVVVATSSSVRILMWGMGRGALMDVWRDVMMTDENVGESRRFSARPRKKKEVYVKCICCRLYALLFIHHCIRVPFSLDAICVAAHKAHCLREAKSILAEAWLAGPAGPTSAPGEIRLWQHRLSPDFYHASIDLL